MGITQYSLRQFAEVLRLYMGDNSSDSILLIFDNPLIDNIGCSISQLWVFGRLSSLQK